MTRVLAGPYSTMILGDLGAEIIKIEIPDKGDDAREFGPFINGESSYFMSLNRNKKSMTLNLKKEKGKKIFRELIQISDVLVENYRAGTLKKLGFGEKKIENINPSIIYAACSGFGHTGPDSSKPCYDAIAQARSGIMSITGPDKDQPTRVGTSIADITAGLFTTIGILSALYARKNTVSGQKVDISMLDSQVAILENALARYFVSGKDPEPLGNRHPSIVPFESFKTFDGEIMIAAGNDSLWKKLCKIIGKQELADDPRFINNRLRNENYPQLRSILKSIIETKTTDEWIDLFENGGIPVSKINKISDIVEDKQIASRNMIVNINHPRAGKIKMPNSPIKLSETPCQIKKPSPLLGEDTDKILNDYLNYDKKTIIELRKEKVI